MTNPLYPTQLKKTDHRSLIITWSDESEQEITFRKLRDSCSCANCMEKHSASDPTEPTLGSLPILSAAEARPLDVERMSPVGNYAYNIHFSDGHNTGIYTFDLLRAIN